MDQPRAEVLITAGDRCADGIDNDVDGRIDNRRQLRRHRPGRSHRSRTTDHDHHRSRSSTMSDVDHRCHGGRFRDAVVSPRFTDVSGMHRFGALVTHVGIDGARGVRVRGAASSSGRAGDLIPGAGFETQAAHQAQETVMGGNRAGGLAAVNTLLMPYTHTWCGPGRPLATSKPWPAPYAEGGLEIGTAASRAGRANTPSTYVHVDPPSHVRRWPSPALVPNWCWSRSRRIPSSIRRWSPSDSRASGS